MSRLSALRSLDVSEIAPQLWQGSAPPPGKVLDEAGFDVLVLCAREYQPSDKDFPGLVVLRCPIDDAPITSDDWMVAVSAALAASRLMLTGKRVLVTCQMGLNRSGLVSGLILILRGMSGAQAVARVRSRRFGTLFNSSFVRALKAAGAR